MAHFYPDTRSILQIFASRLLQEGDSPQHVAVIMDGNRRYAVNHGLERKQGHTAGSEKAAEVMRWGYEIYNRELTLYAFSIENFKRSKDQVDELMGLAEDFCHKTIVGLREAKKHDICVQFIGNWDLVPTKLKPDAAKIMLETRHCKGYKVNVAFAYTGRNGIERSLKSIQRGIKDGQLLAEDVTEYLIDEAQNLMPMKPVDMLLRTGGDQRLSDFMIWEASHSFIHIVKSTWPELSFWELWDAVIKYQMFRRTVPKRPPSRDALTKEQQQRADAFLKGIREKQWQVLAKCAERYNRPQEVIVQQHFEETWFRAAIKKLLAF